MTMPVFHKLADRVHNAVTENRRASFIINH